MCLQKYHFLENAHSCQLCLCLRLLGLKKHVILQVNQIKKNLKQGTVYLRSSPYLHTLTYYGDKRSSLYCRPEITLSSYFDLNWSGHEGRIGMAAIKLKENMDFDGKAAYQHVKNYLPSYARPRFIRIQVNKVQLKLTYNMINNVMQLLYNHLFLLCRMTWL